MREWKVILKGYLVPVLGLELEVKWLAIEDISWSLTQPGGCLVRVERQNGIVSGGLGLELVGKSGEGIEDGRDGEIEGEGIEGGIGLE